MKKVKLIFATSTNPQTNPEKLQFTNVIKTIENILHNSEKKIHILNL